MLFGRRVRLKELADAEARGRSLWTDRIDDSARWKLWYAVEDFAHELNEYSDTVAPLEWARRATLKELGRPNLAGWEKPRQDVSAAILNAEEALVWSLLEALLVLASAVAWGSEEVVTYPTLERYRSRLPLLRMTIKTVLLEHRVNLDLVNDRFVPFESRDLHESVVVPTLTLLGHDPDYERVESSYRSAIKEVQSGNPEDAITDVGTALQTMLELLGCEGNSLGPLLKSAQTRGLLGPHDSPLTTAIGRIIDWVSADRSTKGDAHNANLAHPEDAWLTIHVVGALILRLAAGTARGSTPN